MFGIEFWIVNWHWESEWRWGLHVQHQAQVSVQFSYLTPEIMKVTV